MNYSAVSIANFALLRIGARGTISSFQENSPNAVKVNQIWNFVFPQVLSERDWKFAKTKVFLQQSASPPVFGYRFAYALPSDFLRLVRPKEIPQERRIAEWNNYGSGGWGGEWGGWGNRNFQSDVPVWPRAVQPYITETVLTPGSNPPVYTTCLLTNYGPCGAPCNPPQPPPQGCLIPPGITYIRLITDLTQLLPGFTDALTFRLAAELAIAITEDKAKAQSMMEMYYATLNGALAQEEIDDSLKDEAGSTTWQTAGRWGRGRGWR